MITKRILSIPKEFGDILLGILSRSGVRDWETRAIQRIGYEVLKIHFDYDERHYNLFFEKLAKNAKALEKFDDVMRFYYFWCRRPTVFRVLHPDFKLIVMFSLIERLISDQKYLSLDQWMQNRMHENPYAINNMGELNKLLEEYHAAYGSNTKVRAFFERHYPPEAVEELKTSLQYWNETNEQFENITDIGELIGFLLGIRNLFIHRATHIQISSQEDYEKEAEGYTSFSAELLTVVKGKSYAVNSGRFHIEKLLAGFEMGVIRFFEHSGNDRSHVKQ